VNDAVHQHSFQAFSQSRRQTSDITRSGKTAECANSDVGDVKTISIEFLIDQNKNI